MLRVGLTGIGFMGWIHYLAWKNVPGAQVVAFHSSDAGKRAGDWSSIRGNFGPPGEKIDVSGMRRHATLDALLADAEIDLVDICSPPHAHAAAIDACLVAGKHVLCEKPLALDDAEAQRLARAAAAAGRRLMVAHVLPFLPEFALLLDAHRDGRYGALVTGRFRRVIGPPDWIPDFYDPARIGGPLIDLHVHDAHLMRLLFGMPRAVTARATQRDGQPKFIEALIDFPDGRFAAATCGVTDAPGRPFCHGYEVQFERATLQFDFVALQDGTESLPLKILHADGRIERPAVGSGDMVDAFTAELSLAAAIATGRQAESILDGGLAADALTICQAIARATASGRTEAIGLA
ncbi:MAG: Gfo/Idh/MocA family protein [Verrucomicrobiales bacterium]